MKIVVEKAVNFHGYRYYTIIVNKEAKLCINSPIVLNWKGPHQNNVVGNRIHYKIKTILFTQSFLIQMKR